MLLLPLRPVVRHDVFKSLADWLDGDSHTSFTPANPLQFVVPKPEYSSAACRDDLLRLATLRNELAESLLKPESHQPALDEGALERLEDYHATLLAFERQGFPTLDDQLNGVKLTWKGAFAPQQETHYTLVWDRANCLFNIVALLTFCAAKCSLTDRDQCKAAVGYCQLGVGLLKLLEELVESQFDFATVDLSAPMLRFWQTYLLAEAQTFVYRMMALSSPTNYTTLASLAQSAFELMRVALQSAQDPRLESEVPAPATTWATYCKAHGMLHASKAAFHQANLHKTAHAWGAEIVRLQTCVDKLQACRDFIGTVKEQASKVSILHAQREAAAYLPLVQDRLTEARKDNHNVYHDDIPKSVDDVTPKQLAKANDKLPEAMIIPQRSLFTNV